MHGEPVSSAPGHVGSQASWALRTTDAGDPDVGSKQEHQHSGLAAVECATRGTARMAHATTPYRA